MNLINLIEVFIAKYSECIEFKSDRLTWKISNIQQTKEESMGYTFSIVNQDESIERGVRRELVSAPLPIMSSERPQLAPMTMYLRGANRNADEKEMRDYSKIGDFSMLVFNSMVSTLILNDNELSVINAKKNIVKYMSDLVEINSDTITFACKHCHSQIVGQDNIEYCSDCLKDTYTCSVCNNTYGTVERKHLTGKDGSIMCIGCMKTKVEDVGSKWKDYSDKPVPKFFGEGRHYGIEVEVEFTSSEDYSIRDSVSYLASQNEHLYFKRDGSLNNGVEVISFPCTIDYHREHTLNALKVLEQLSFKGEETCGIHIHTGKDGFGDTVEQKVINIGRILWLSTHFIEELKKISLRMRYDYCEPNDVPRNSGNNIQVGRSLIGASIKDTEKSMSDIAKSYFTTFYNHGSRYKVINLCYKPTVEFRLPQSVLDNDTFMAFLQLYDRMIEIAISDIDFTTKDFSELFVGYGEELDKHLMKHL